MPIVIKSKGRLAAPCVVCDHCGEEIEDARDGNYQWVMGRSATEPAQPVYFTHKACCAPFEAARPGDHYGAVCLDVLPVYLANGLGVNLPRAKRKAALYASIG